jgi:type IV pilus assembly protein PilA
MNHQRTKGGKTMKDPNKGNGFTLVELMVVIVIVGILAAVAIPKFLDASNKAKASEFPTQLTAIYIGQMAFNAENGSYCPDFVTLRSTGCVDITSTSKWFNYTLPATGSTSTFIGRASVANAFGIASVGDNATIDQTNAKACPAGNLSRYVPTWK